MNLLAQTLVGLCDAADQQVRQAGHGRWAQGFHLMPASGWLNDPNGLHQADGVYHAYYQASPDVDCGLKCWGHATSRDLLHWEPQGTAIVPSTHWDCHGVYSGSALVVDGQTHFFYTGNVKHEDEGASYDYVTSGRESNQMAFAERDGRESRPKRVVLRQADYPADETAHVRDPKVFCTDGLQGLGKDAPRYLMLLAGRRAGATRDEDSGEALVYGSDDLDAWSLLNRVATPERFGYVWECPDYLELGAGPDGCFQVLSVSPQGLDGPEWEGRNVYQSGWFPFCGDLLGECSLGDFHLWDHGFDFYAPQTFEDEKGRRILIGWMGMPDTPAHRCLERDDGWQHCFTVPREVVTDRRDGEPIVLCRPVAEVAELRGDPVRATDTLELDAAQLPASGPKSGGEEQAPAAVEPGVRAFDLEVSGIGDSLSCRLCDELELTWRREEGLLRMRFADPSQDAVGAGREERTCPVADLRELRVLLDASSAEVFVNGGEHAMSTRLYPRRYGLRVEAPGAEVVCWPLEV